MTTSAYKVTLNNGLNILLKEIHTMPLISQWVWYRIGSRDETPGKTGISHWVEHMQFKGTKQFPVGVLDKAISRDGGIWNAFTYLDWTTYFETLPSARIELAMNLEADRMANSLFEINEVESERSVVISEREGNENEPLFRLDEAVQFASFDSHSYRNEIIGSMEDLKKIQREDLYRHYQSYYVPNNAVVAIAGDFQTQDVITLLEKYFGKISPGAAPAHPAKVEPALESERQLEVSGPGETTYIHVAYRAPAANSKDFFMLTILDSLLTGPTSLNMFGGGLSNKTSRLYRSLVENELAVSIHGGLQATIDPFLFDIVATVHPDCSAETVLKAIDQEIERLQNDLVSVEEVKRATKQARALFAYGSENITNQAFWLGFSEMFASYDWFVNYVEELEKVTPEDVQKIAQEYLSPKRRVVGVYVPDMQASSEVERENE